IAAAKNDGSSTIITDGDVVGNDDDNASFVGFPRFSQAAKVLPGRRAKWWFSLG
ncbi:unnamed protein product, partial [Ascophyllum nodosum]